MGRMKELYMEIMQQNGEVPEDFSLAEYNLQKELEYEELREMEEKFKAEQNSGKNASETTPGD